MVKTLSSKPRVSVSGMPEVFQPIRKEKFVFQIIFSILYMNFAGKKEFGRVLFKLQIISEILWPTVAALV